MADEISDELIARNEELLEEDKFKEAEEVADEILELNPDDALALYIMGRTLYLEGQFEDALTHLSKSAEIDKTRSETWTTIGLCLIALGRAQEAEESLKYVNAADENNLLAKYALGLVYIIKGDEAGGMKLIKEVFSRDSKLALKYSEQVYTRLIFKSANVSSTTKTYIERAMERWRLGI